MQVASIPTYPSKESKSTFDHLLPDTIICFLDAPYDLVRSRLLTWFPTLSLTWSSIYGDYYNIDSISSIRLSGRHNGVHFKAFGPHTSRIIHCLNHRFRFEQPIGRWWGNENVNIVGCRLLRVDWCIDFNEEAISRHLLDAISYNAQAWTSTRGIKSKINLFNTTLYIGGRGAKCSLCIYDKTAQLRTKGMVIGAQVNRLEFRLNLKGVEQYEGYQSPIYPRAITNPKIGAVLNALDRFFATGELPPVYQAPPVMSGGMIRYLDEIGYEDQDE